MPKRESRPTFGARAADAVAARVGSWMFIWVYVVLTMFWMVENWLGPFRFDGYPFIAYTCAVSVLAILLSSLILLAQNRQSHVDRIRDDREASEVDSMFNHLTAMLIHMQVLLEMGERQRAVLEQQNITALEQHEKLSDQLTCIISMMQPYYHR